MKPCGTWNEVPVIHEFAARGSSRWARLCPYLHWPWRNAATLLGTALICWAGFGVGEAQAGSLPLKETVLTATRPGNFGTLGSNVAISENYLVVAANGYNNDTSRFEGLAIVFERGPSGAWVEAARLAPPISTDSSFGFTVSLDGNRIAVGDSSDDTSASDAGAVYVYQRSVAGVWQPLPKVTAGTDAGANLAFGSRVALSGDYLAIVEGGTTRAVFVYERTPAGAWEKKERLTRAYAGFGISIALHGTTLLVGAPNHDSERGNVTVFSRNTNGTWSETALLVGSIDQGGRKFGTAVAVNGGSAAVSSSYDITVAGSPFSLGSVDFFQRSESGVWQFVQRAEGGDGFGRAVALEGTRAVIGADYFPQSAVGYIGTAFVYARTLGPGSEPWELIETIHPTDQLQQGRFGSSVAVHRSNVVVGASSQQNGLYKGYLFTPSHAYPPEIVVDAENQRLVVSRNAASGGEITHFRILDQRGINLLRPNGTPLTNGGYITLAEGITGLTFTAQPGASPRTVTMASCFGVSAENQTGAASTTVSVDEGSGPVRFRLETDYPIAHEHDGQMICRVLKTGGSPGTATTWTAALTLDADNNGSATAGLDYENPPEALRTLVFNSHDVAKSLVIPVIAGDFDDGALLEEFDIVLTTPPGGGATIVEADTYNPVAGLGVARAFIVDSDAVSVELPVDPPPGPTLPLTGDGVLTVNFEPTDIGGGWRVFPETAWRASGTTATGLELRQHLVEFKPVPGYATPETTRVEAFAVADAGNVPLLALYRPQATGSLLANVTTDGAPGSGQWRRRGETTWRNGGTMEAGLAPGRYVVEFRPVAGLVTPPARAVDIPSGATASTAAHYRAALVFPGTPARPTALAQVEADPYWFVGQVRTEGGTATGTVVGGGHVVLTAAHALFDEVNLRFWTRVEWLFQRHGSTEPAPRVPRGMHIFGRGYSRQYETQRRLEGTPGVASLDSDDLDVAALIFYEPAGRFDELNDLKGSAGVVSANGADNPWFIDQPGTPRDRVLVGYPVENELGEIAPANVDKMHATTLAPHTFTAVSPRVFRSTALQGFRGMDGAPVFVRDDNALLSVAGIYLGGYGESRVRAIDAGIVQLIAQAQFWGENQVDGTGDNFQPVAVRSDNIQAGYLQVQMNQANGRWRLQGASIYQSPTVKVRLTSAAQMVEFKPVANYVTPLPFATPIGATEGFFVEVIYLPINTYGRWRAENFPSEMDLPLTSGQDADPDCDGLKNSLEYAFNLAPKEAGHPVFAEGGDPTGLPSVSVTGTPPNARLTVEFVRRRGTTGLTYAPEFTGNLAGPWVSGTEVFTEIIDGFWEKVRVEDVATTTGATRRFVRVSVTVTQ